ncbi:MAG: alpha/beta hydrolase [Novosphingobium sp.]|jgi:uncharacterized membrane protein|uniref:alpha/beta hydrolase n=1 Tax=Novosphingobium sp. TaxID=1874826 RepID=UPI003B9C51EC
MMHTRNGPSPNSSSLGFITPLEPYGLLLGAIAFLASLIPSLIPRGELVQGVTGGLAFALGYAAGVGLRWLAENLQIVSRHQLHSRRRWPAAGVSAAIVLIGLALAPSWQNGVRAAMRLPHLEGFSALLAGLAALVTAVAFIAFGRLFRRLWSMLSGALRPLLPPRLATLSGLAFAIGLTWSVTSGLMGRLAVDAFDRTYARLDALIPRGGSPPADPLKSGGPGSLVSWTSLGAQGREHMLAGPTRAEIESLAGADALEPIRVYVGLNAAETVRVRAELALAELRRTGAFDRGTLVIATPTGTGWIDAAGTAPLEYLLRGDVATVAVQYSYLPSWLSLLVEPENGVETAREVFRLIHRHWAALPPERRPKLYLFGLSLGALNSDLAVDLYDIMAAPHHGALWVGPPFHSPTWREIVTKRNEGTPAWAPRYSDGRMFRFATQDSSLADNYGAWGPLRVIYLQYPSDPIVFFQTGSLWRKPPIAEEPRPPDVARDFRWIPVISFVQMVVDMMTATTAPRGFGHVYAAEHYLSAWTALLEPVGWPPERLEALGKRLKEHGL